MALSAFCRVIELISSRELEVSSRDAACSDAPSARDWLEEEIWEEAEETWSLVWERVLIVRLMGSVMERMDRLTRNPRISARNTAQDIKIIKEGQPVRGALRNNIFQVEIISLLPLPDHFMIYTKLFESPKELDFEIKIPRYFERKYNLYSGKKIRVAIPEKQIVLVS